jgi:hypothetical protein
VPMAEPAGYRDTDVPDRQRRRRRRRQEPEEPPQEFANPEASPLFDRTERDLLTQLSGGGRRAAANGSARNGHGRHDGNGTD